jgi:hypothetical protein
MDGRHTFTLGLWLLSAAVLCLAMVRLGPWLWVNLFPGAEETIPVEDEQFAGASAAASNASSSEQAAEALHRVLSNWGVGNAPEPERIYLPQGRRPGELQDTLRGLDSLSKLEVYVTRVDDLLFRLRIYSGARLLLQRDVFPFLPERPSVTGVDPPEASVLVLLGEEESDVLDRICSWRSPLAIVLPPFAAHAVKSMRFASRCSKGVVLLLDPEDDVSEQLASAPEASGVLLVDELEDSLDLNRWLRPFVSFNVFLVDGRPSGSLPSIEGPARSLGLRYVRWAGQLQQDSDLILARNLTVRRGYGLVSARGDDEGMRLLETFLEDARDDGYNLLFPAEVAREHGLRQPPSR